MLKLDIDRIKGKKILAIGAHPDDVDIGASGTLLLLSKRNHITVVLVTSGQMGTHDAKIAPHGLIARREQEQRDASAKYKASRVIFFQFPDMNVAREGRRLRKRLVKLILRSRPDIIITHDPWTEYFPYHPDHRATGFAVYDAAITSTLPLYLEKRSVHGQPLEKQPAIWFMHPHEPSHGVDITAVYKQKLVTIKLHESQFEGKGEWEKVEKLLECEFGKIGKEIGTKYGEGFRVIECL